MAPIRLAPAARPGIDLDRIRIASPCPARWEDMTGNEQVRHCERCALDVYDSTGLSATELRQLIESRAGGRVCLRLHRRADGRILTRDCPVGVRRFYARLSAVVALAFAAVGLPRAGAAPTSVVTGEAWPPNIGVPAQPPDVASQPPNAALEPILDTLDALRAPGHGHLDRLLAAVDQCVATRARERSPALGDAYHVRARLRAYWIHLDTASEPSRSVRRDQLAMARRDVALAIRAYAAPGATSDLRLRLQPWMTELDASGRLRANAGEGGRRELAWSSPAKASADLSRFAAAALADATVEPR